MTLQSKQVQPFVLNPSILHETCPHSCCRIVVCFLAKTCAITPGCLLFNSQSANWNSRNASCWRELKHFARAFGPRIKSKWNSCNISSPAVCCLYAHVCIYAFLLHPLNTPQIDNLVTQFQSSKERISGDVVVFSCVASVSSRSWDQDPIWTPCGRSSHGTRQIRRRNLAELHAPRTWKTSKRNYTRTLAHGIADGMHTGLVQVQSAKDLNESKRYLSGLCMVNGAKFEFHPIVTQHHESRTIFYDQGSSWHR